MRALRRYNPPRSRTLWADKPWPGKLGTYIGIRLDADQILVAIKTPTYPYWVRDSDALTESEARLWSFSSRWR